MYLTENHMESVGPCSNEVPKVLDDHMGHKSILGLHLVQRRDEVGGARMVLVLPLWQCLGQVFIHIHDLQEV